MSPACSRRASASVRATTGAASWPSAPRPARPATTRRCDGRAQAAIIPGESPSPRVFSLSRPVETAVPSALASLRRHACAGLAGLAGLAAVVALVVPQDAGLFAGIAAVLAFAAAAWPLIATARVAGPATVVAAESERPAADLFDEAPIGIAYLAHDGRILQFNEAFAALTGQPLELLRRVRFEELVAPDDRAGADALLAAAAAPDAHQQRGELTLTAPPGSTNAVRRAVAAYVRPAANLGPAAAADAARLILHLIDITNFKELENQVVQARKMQAVGQLAGGVAHDFNNLLTAMIGFCDLLLLRHRAGDQSFADIMQIKQNANRAASLVRQLLAFSRQQTLRPKVLDITDTLAELSHLLRRLIGQNVVLKIIHGRDLGLVRVDQSQFEQVIINLAVNARDAMPTGGGLTVRTSNVSVTEPLDVAHETMPPGDYVRIEVIDSGVGIPKDVQARIFEPFFTTKPVGMGTGLGLSTVYGIVRQTGGFILVDSELGPGPNHGTTFAIYLPRHAGSAADDRPATDDAERSDADLTGSATVLLVEDEDPVRLFTARALRNKGYKVMEAKSGEAALELLGGLTDRIDVLITDAVMPVIDGPALIKLVREQRPDIRVICISGHTDEALRERIRTAGDVLFLPKPFSL
ncbi:MAG: response regulator, partial [Alphaproteobacteria bacterium]|nr:response regulator [Alphaproteobacteria bacterium]